MRESLKHRLKSFERKQLIASLLGLLILFCLSIVFNYIHLSGQATQTSKFISRMIQVEDFREVGITLQEARLDHFSTIRYISSDPRRSFTLPELADLMPDKSFWRRLTYDEVVVDIPTITTSRDKIIFEFSRLKEIGWAFLVWVVLNLVSIPQTRLMKKRIVEGFDESLRIETELARAEVARKLRHNIRTPLSALIRLSNRKGASEHNQELLSNVITHIKNLVSDLDEPNKKVASDNLFHPILNDAMREVRLVSPGRLIVTTQVDDSLISAHGDFIGHELRSILTNLATNAFEATPDGGRVDLVAQDFGDRVIIEVKDNGKGIPLDIQSKVTEKGFSFGKPTGTGLGLHHAKENIEAWNGSLRISSEVGLGTSIQVTLPIQSREPWYVPRIKLKNSDTVVVVDDQVTVHDIWRERLREAGFSGGPTCHETAGAALSFLSSRSDTSSGRVIVFADYDLGTQKTGIDLLAEISPNTEKFLVTGHFDDPTVQMACKIRQIPLIPKTALSDIPIVVV